MKITIVGAGIGGLTTAIALRKQGLEVEVFENTPKFTNAGSGINLAINAMQVYKRLGVYDDIVEKSHHTHAMNAREKDFSILSQMDLTKFEKKFHAKTVAIHRSVLHEILLDHLGDCPLYLDKKLDRLEQHREKTTLFFEDGSQHEADIVIGADGIHSAVRQSIFPQAQLRDARQVCWRGIAKIKLDKAYANQLNELWGRGNRIGFVHINDEEVYWFALIDKDKFTHKDIDLLPIFQDYHPMVKDILSATDRSQILCNEIWDLKPMDSWHQGNICLLGDACHATTPNLGQGAVQAIESAMALSICFSEEKDVQQAFARYQQLRKAKAHHITKTSWMIGKLAQSNSRIVCFLRSILIKITPQSVSDKQSMKIYDLNF